MSKPTALEVIEEQSAIQRAERQVIEAAEALEGGHFLRRRLAPQVGRGRAQVASGQGIGTSARETSPAPLDVLPVGKSSGEGS